MKTDAYPDNTIGIKLGESSGLRPDGILRQNCLSDRGYLDQIIYSMLKEEDVYKRQVKGGADKTGSSDKADFPVQKIGGKLSS